MKKALLSVFALLLLVTPLLVAQDTKPLKIGIINMRRVIAESAAGQAAETKVKDFYQNKRNELQQEMKSLQDEVSQLESQRSVLSQEAYLERANQLQKRELDIQQKSKAAERQFQQMQQEEMQKFFKIAGPIVEAIGVEQGFTMIMDNTPTGTNQIIYFDKTIDITDLVIERVNAKGSAQ